MLKNCVNRFQIYMFTATLTLLKSDQLFKEDQ